MRHQLITSAEGWKYKPFADNCITKLKKLGLAYASQQYSIEGFVIKVRIEPGHEYITIDIGFSAIYEFFTTGAVFNPNADLPGTAFDKLNNPGSATRINLGRKTLLPTGVVAKKLRPGPLWSSLLTPAPDSPTQWPVVDRRWWAQNNIWLGARGLYPDNFGSIVSHPSEHFGSYHWYYNNQKDQLVTSCRAAGPGASLQGLRPKTTGVAYLCALASPNKYTNFSYGKVTDVDLTALPVGYYRDRVFSNNYSLAYTSDSPYAWLDTRISISPTFSGTTITNTPYMADAQHTYDSIRFMPESNNESQAMYTFDIPPATYKKLDLTVGAGIAGPYIHWRTAALHKATTSTGVEVPVIVLTDTHNGFMFYAAKNYAAILPPPTTGELGGAPISESYRNLDPSKWVRVNPVMPDWVTLPNEDGAYKELTWQWRFNKTATKAVCTPIHSELGLAYLNVFENYVGTGPTYRAGLVTTCLETAQAGYVTVEVFSIPQMSPEVATDIGSRSGDIWDSVPSAMRAYVSLRPAAGTSAHFFKYLGEYFLLQAGHTPIHPDFSFTAALSPYMDEYVTPAKDITPGVVEVSISVEAEYNPSGGLTITPSVTVTFSDYYTSSKKVYADAAYYVKTSRASKASTSLVIENQPDDDDLLVADIVVKGRRVLDDNGSVVVPSDQRSDGTDGEHIAPSAIRGGAAWYRVTNLTKNNQVAALCLAVQDSMGTTGSATLHTTPTGIVPAIFLAVILAHDLRYLSFITATYYRRMCSLQELQESELGGTAFAHLHNISPRIELRIPGEPLATIDYGKDSCSGYATGSIDMTKVTLTPTFDETGDIEVELGVIGGDRWYRREVSSGENPGTQARFDVFEYGLKTFGSDPLTGIGLTWQDGMRKVTESIASSNELINSFTFDGHLYENFKYTDVYSWTSIATPLTDSCGLSDQTKKRITQTFLPHVTSGQYYTTFSFTPTGDYAVYFDARSAQYPTPFRGTNTNGMLDVIKFNGLYTTHLTAFNAAFSRNSAYSDIPVDGTAKTGRFSTNGIFMYNPPGDSPAS